MSDSKISHEDLDNAIKEPEETQEEVKIVSEEVEEEQEEEIEEEPENNVERSKLGRKVAYLESSVGTLVENMNKFLESQPSPEEQEEEIHEEDLGEFVTKDNFKTFYQKERGEEGSQKAKYNDDYNAFFDKLSDVDHDYNDIIEELKANYNIKRSNDGTDDAITNYTLAKKAVNDKKKNPLTKNIDKEHKNLGGPSETTTTTTAKKEVKLDKAAQDFYDYTKKTDKPLNEDKIREILT